MNKIPYIITKINEPIIHSLGKLKNPLSLFEKIKHLPYPVFLDSSLPHKTRGRYSFISADPYIIMKHQNNKTIIFNDNFKEIKYESPFNTLNKLLLEHTNNLNKTNYPKEFQGGAIGFFSYDTGRLLENIPSIAKNDQNLPEILLGFYNWLIIHDNETYDTFITSTGAPNKTLRAANFQLNKILNLLKTNQVAQNQELFNYKIGPFKSNFTKTNYINSINKIKDYLQAGDAYQVNLSQRFESIFDGDPWSLYLAIRKQNPTNFSAFLDFPEITILSISPEQFMKINNDHIESRPIKGTKIRSNVPDIDSEIAKTLFQSKKDRAENLMIVDLIRNDLAKICIPGTIKVPELFSLEKTSSVWHLVSSVIGQLRKDASISNVLEAAIPGGSITGTPKIRSMQIIEELEPVRRNLYCGTITFIPDNKTLNSSIAIRTITIQKEKLYLSLGGGITFESNPEDEYNETIAKGKSILESIQL